MTIQFKPGASKSKKVDGKFVYTVTATTELTHAKIRGLKLHATRQDAIKEAKEKLADPEWIAEFERLLQ